LLAAALAERSVGDYDAALEEFTRAEELDPRSLAVVRRRAEVLLYLHRWAETRQALDRALGISPSDLYCHVLMAMSHLGAGNLPEARRVIAAVPPAVDRVALMVNMAAYGDLYWVLDEATQRALLDLPVSAFDDYRVAWTLVRTQVYHLRGNNFLARTWADSAHQAIVAQLRQVPNDAQLHAFRGLASAYLGRRAEAIAEGERAVELVPVSRDAFNGPYLEHLLTRIYILLGESEKALGRLEPLLQRPYSLSPGWLRIDPTFQPLRDNPRFIRLAQGDAGP